MSLVNDIVTPIHLRFIFSHFKCYFCFYFSYIDLMFMLMINKSVVHSCILFIIIMNFYFIIICYLKYMFEINKMWERKQNNAEKFCFVKRCFTRPGHMNQFVSSMFCNKNPFYQCMRERTTIRKKNMFVPWHDRIRGEKEEEVIYEAPCNSLSFWNKSEQHLNQHIRYFMGFELNTRLI